MLNLRRIVTGHNAAGKSVVLSDGPPPRIILDRVAELWFTDEIPASNVGEVDTTDRPASMQPPAGGSVFRCIMVPPRDDERNSKTVNDEVLKTLNAEKARVDVSRDAGMHRTDTVDYVMLLSGELTMMLDEGEVNLKPFDIVIQRGTNHSWINRGKEPAILLGTNIDAKPLDR